METHVGQVVHAGNPWGLSRGDGVVERTPNVQRKPTAVDGVIRLVDEPLRGTRGLVAQVVRAPAFLKCGHKPRPGLGHLLFCTAWFDAQHVIEARREHPWGLDVEPLALRVGDGIVRRLDVPEGF